MNYFQIILISFILSSCSLPQFSFKSGGSETKEIDAKTVQVDYFQNKSAIGGPFLGASFTESLRDIMQSQTKLDLVDNNGDLQISWNIKNYNMYHFELDFTKYYYKKYMQMLEDFGF